DAPADPELPQATRPEWYFLFLFELRGYFTGDTEFIATVIIPVAILLFLLALPFLDAMLPEAASRWMRYAVVFGGLAAWSGLTGLSMWRDHNDPHVQAEASAAHALALRADELADAQAIPPTGAAALLQNDALTQGPKLYKQYCVSCHPYTTDQFEITGSDEPSAPDLGGFATRNWIAGFLDPERIVSAAYFGNTEHAEGEMASFVKDEMDLEAASLDDVLAALVAEADLPQHHADAEAAAAGRELIAGEAGCTDCHKFHDDGDIGVAPDLTGYGSRQWLLGFLNNPEHDRFYGEYNDRMPGYDPELPTAPMNQQELDMLADWLRGQWYRPTAIEVDDQTAASPAEKPADESSDEPTDKSAKSDDDSSSKADDESTDTSGEES
ncbi:MAG: c-type cytochrome, partial [Planctomycetales bacterium]|nr:c-type cytochrome [Planctomycetales bacterium]